MRKSLFVLLLLMLAGVYTSFSAERGLKNTIRSLDKYAKVGKQYAVIVAINEYESWNPLKGPLKDASKLKDVLSRRYYIDEFIELYNEDATKTNIIKLFKNLQDKVKTEDSVMIFYAGHGHLDESSGTGFWIPVNGGTDEDVQDNWLTNQQIRGFINNIKSRHVCLISDSCFSGDMLNVNRAAQPKITNTYYQNAYTRISRQILTSGASETVSDSSDFAKQLVLALEGNNRPIIDPMMLFNEIKLGVRGQTPMFGELKSTGHQTGASFLLFKKAEQEVVEESEIIEEEIIEETLEKVEDNIKKEITEIEIPSEFEKELTVKLDEILSSNKNSKIVIEGHYVMLDKIKKQISSSGKSSSNLNNKIKNVEKSLSLSHSLINIADKREKGKKNLVGYLAGGSALMGLGVVSGVTMGAMFGLQYDYTNKVDLALNGLDSGDISSRDDAIYNQNMANSFFISGITLIPVTAVMVIAGAVIYGVAPYDFKFTSQMDRIKNQIEKFNLSMTVGDEKAQFAFTIKL